MVRELWVLVGQNFWRATVLHVYKLRSRTSQSKTRHFTIHLTTHFVSCSQLLTVMSPE
jgi:hypothetical protein